MSAILGTETWVAIVDDDEPIRRALQRLLRAHGINATAFHSARDYLTRAPSAPACICLDVYLHDEMTGLDLAEQLRARGTATPIIFMTGQDRSELAPAIRDAWPGVILRKPLDSDLLLELVRHHARVFAERASA